LRKKFLIIDSFALFFRAFYGVPPLTLSDGTMVNAVYGFLNQLFSALKNFDPDYIICAFEGGTELDRKKIFTDYKANRTEPIPEFIQQIPILESVLNSFNLPIKKQEGYEADDIIGSIVNDENLKSQDFLFYILTGDNDLLQLVEDDRVFVYTFGRNFSEGILYNEKKVLEKYGFGPKKLVDFKGLKGDPSDNIPGVSGIGDKTATNLILRYGTVEEIYKKLENGEISTETSRVLNLLVNGKNSAILSKNLATIEKNLKVEIDLEKSKSTNLNRNGLKKILNDLKFFSLIKRLDQINEKFFSEFKNSGDVFHKISLQNDFEDMNKNFLQNESLNLFQNQMFSQSLESSSSQNFTQKNFEFRTTIVTDENFSEILQKIKNERFFAFDTETDSTNSHTANMISLSVAIKPNETFYFPFNHKIGKNLSPTKIALLSKIFENPESLKIAHNFKFDMQILENSGIKVSTKKIFDTMIAGHLISNGKGESVSLDNLSLLYFNYTKISFDSLFPENFEGEKSFEFVDLERGARYCTEDSFFTFLLFQEFKKFVGDFDSTENVVDYNRFPLQKIFELEMKVLPVISKIERNGVNFDKRKAEILNKNYREIVTKLALEIQKIAGIDFNVNSAKELSEVLFEKLKLSQVGIKKTIHGRSTGEETLEKLKDLHPIISKILEYRHFEKIRNTYLEKLPNEIANDGRIHTHYSQIGVISGRLSSSNPNLQNIPKVSEIEELFVAKDSNHKLVSIDYSQIELRIMAKISEDKNLIDDLNQGLDIHAITASKIFGKNFTEITKDERQIGKTINFSIIYGVTEFGLAKSLRISSEEAKIIIQKFFKSFPNVYRWMEKTILSARENGFVKTFFGRVVHIPLLKSVNKNLVAQGDRMAINIPIQGTGAEIIKLAMIRVQEFLDEKNLKTKMVLQIHDELTFDVPNEEMEILDEIKFIMQKVGVEILGISLPVEIKKLS